MSKRAIPHNPSCPHCGSGYVQKNGHANGQPAQQRFRCRACERSFGLTFGTPLYRLRTPAAEVAQSLLIVMRRGSLSAAEEITGHKYETIGVWLRRAGEHAQALTEALVRDLCLSEVEVDAFWSFVKKSVSLLPTRATHRRAWAKSLAAGPQTPGQGSRPTPVRSRVPAGGA
jgi:transposase-like protein